MPKFKFNYSKSIFKFPIFCLWIKNIIIYNIQNNPTIILIIMSGEIGA
jgi:hypothetical protein